MTFWRTIIPPSKISEWRTRKPGDRGSAGWRLIEPFGRACVPSWKGLTVDELQGYINYEYVEEIREIEELRDLVNKILPTFSTFFDDARNQWPYKVEEGKVWKIEDHYSFPTNAMIAFMAGVALWGSEKSVLVPGLRPDERPQLADDLSKKFKTIFDSATDTLLKHLSVRDGPVTTSGTFGTDDPFTLTWTLEVAELSRANGAARIDEARHAKLVNAAQNTVRNAYTNRNWALEGLPNELQTFDHAFPLLRCIQLADALPRSHGDWSPGNQPDGSQLLERLTATLHRQLSSFSIPRGEHDVAELVFALEGILRLQPEFNKEVIERTLKIIMEGQERVPYWRPVRPFIANPRGFVLLPISVEVANSLLRICDIIRDGGETFSRNLVLFRNYAYWLRSKVIRGQTSDGSKFIGWHSEHVLAPGTIHLWMTSQSLLFVLHYAAMLQKHVARRLLLAGRFQKQGLPGGSKLHDTAEGLFNREPLIDAPEKSAYRITQRIAKHFVWPRTKSGSLTHDSADRHFSMLLFGPPGTGKTTIVRKMAEAIGYDLVTITPSDFVKGGESQVELHAKAIFTALKEQSRVVVLFDEIDRLLLDRDSMSYHQQGDIFQFMTPGMLTKLNDLRKTERVIFVIATNYAERIDAALMRPGRIDDHFLLLPPSLAGRKKILAKLVSERADVKLSDADVEEVARKTALWIYDELDELVKEACRNMKGTGGDVAKRLQEALSEELRKGTVNPTNRLLNYERRMSLKRKSEWPFEELLLMLYLVGESRDLTAEEKKMLLKRRAALQSGLPRVRDEELRNKLEEVLSKLSD